MRLGRLPAGAATRDSKQEAQLKRGALLLSVSLATCQVAAVAQTSSLAAPVQYGLNFDAKAALLWHPLEKPLDRGLVVSISVNGKKIKAAIDTGNTLKTGIMLTSQAANNLGIVTTSGIKRTLTYLGSQDAGAGVVENVAFGGVSFSNLPVAIKKQFGYDADVEAIIGTELLKYVTLVVDPGDRRVRFLFPGELASLKRGVNLIPLEDSLHFAASSVGVKFCNGDASLLVDTGDNGDVRFKTSLFQRARCSFSVESDARAETSAGALISRRMGMADVIMGGVSLGPVLAEEMLDKQAQALGIDGTVGLGVLSRFSFALDISSRRLLVLGYSPANTGIERPTIGIELKEIPNALEITYIEKNSPASKSILKAGDTICSVGGKTISQLGDDFDTNPVPGSDLRLGTCDGRAVSIIASDFLFPGGVPRSVPTNLPITEVGGFTTAVADCLYGDDKGKTASCTNVIDAPPETRLAGDFRIVAFLYRAKGKGALGDTKGAQEDYRQVLALDPSNANALAALKGVGL